MPYYSLHCTATAYKWAYFFLSSTLRAESIKFFRGILVQTIFSKRHFEINWPLLPVKKRWRFRKFFVAFSEYMNFKHHDNVFSVNCTWSLPQMRFQPIKLLLFVCNVCSFIIFEFQGSSIGFQKEILKYLALFRRNTETIRTLVLIFCLLPTRTPKKIRAYFKRPNGSPYSCDSFDPSPHFVSELS